MKITMIAALSIATATTALPVAAVAHADNDSFQSPSGNIVCVMGSSQPSGTEIVACQVQHRTYAAPPPGDCQLGGWGSQIDLHNPNPAHFECVGGVLAVPPMPTLDYGQTRTAGPITCDSEPAGMTCTDSGTGHFFRVSQQSYQLG